MRAVINGLRYDTDKAERIGGASGGDGRRDFRYFEEDLYITPRAKRFFLAGEGGPMSRYEAKAYGGNGWTGSQRIIPLDEAEAREWAERYLDADTVARYFTVEDA